MKPLELYSAWAPPGARWSPWVKPVLFAAEQAPDGGAAGVWEAARSRSRGRWTPPRALDSVVVLDLPGPDALALALDCAAHGWRPVPLFNSCTGPFPLVDNEPLRVGLIEGAALLGDLTLLDEAAPAFVLDSRRLTVQTQASRFDNRWIVFPQDFPSAARLLSCGLRSVLLVQDGRRDPRTDLAHVLLRWQQAGLEILAIDLAQGATATPIKVSKPGRFRGLGYRVLAALGLRRSSAGGFGAVIPLPTQGGGGWA